MNKIQLLIVNISELDTDTLFAALKEKDKQRIGLITNKQSKNEKIVSTFVKDKYVGDYYVSKEGKPLSDNVYFNISHSHGLLVLALSKSCPVGVDIEKIREIRQSMVRVLSDEEIMFMHLNEDFLKIWVNKEALLKCIGSGINVTLKDVPSLPLNGEKQYRDRLFYSKNFKKDDYYISIVIESNEDFEIEYIK